MNRVSYVVPTCGILLKANIEGQFVSRRPGGGETAQILKTQNQASPQNIDSPIKTTVVNTALNMDEQGHL